MADHSKFGSFGFSVFAKPGDFDILITDSGLPEAYKLRDLGIEVVIADTEG